MNLNIRNEQAVDSAAVSELLKAAFANQPYSQNQEYRLVEALRQAQACTLALLAYLGDQLVGVVYASAVTIKPELPQRWYCIAPLAVAPQFQRQGIGQQLMYAALAQLQAQGAQGCVLVGDPHYYERFGFVRKPGLVSPEIPDEFVLQLAWQNAPAQGEVHYHPAFAELE
jgi:putative acetyltransferase